MFTWTTASSSGRDSGSIWCVSILYSPLLRQSAGLTLNISKCRFCVRDIAYLGYILSDGNIRTDERNIQAITNIQRPRNVSEVRSFLGAAGYYRRFGLGAVLAQVVDGEERPVLFLSRRLTGVETRYHLNEQECLALIWALERLRAYLLNAVFAPCVSRCLQITQH